MAVDVPSLPVHTVLVCYPSGQEFTVTGHWLGPTGRNGRLDAVVMFVWEGGSEQATCVALDPRGVYVALETRAVLYQPRQHPYRTQHAGWVRHFLRAHPTWPQRLLGTRFHDASPPPAF